MENRVGCYVSGGGCGHNCAEGSSCGDFVEGLARYMLTISNLDANELKKNAEAWADKHWDKNRPMQLKLRLAYDALILYESLLASGKGVVCISG